MTEDSISLDRLREVLIYCPITGDFVWRIAKKKTAGKTAGCPNGRGYVLIKIDGKVYSAHRLAWFYTHGVLPEVGIDHRDRNVANNRLSNLRLADQSQNGANRPIQPRNQFRLKGVSKTKGVRFASHIKFKGKSIHLGFYETPELAHQAYCIKAKELFGDFASSGN